MAAPLGLLAALRVDPQEGIIHKKFYGLELLNNNFFPNLITLFFGKHFQTVLADSGSGFKPVLHGIAGTNTI